MKYTIAIAGLFLGCAFNPVVINWEVDSAEGAIAVGVPAMGISPTTENEAKQLMQRKCWTANPKYGFKITREFMSSKDRPFSVGAAKSNIGWSAQGGAGQSDAFTMSGISTSSQYVWMFVCTPPKEGK